MLCSVLYSITTCDKNVEFRVKPDLVILNGQQERHPEGAYYLEWRENGRRVRLSVGNDTTALKCFTESCPKLYVHDIERHAKVLRVPAR